MQKKSIRLITKSRCNTPPYPLFNNLEILPLKHLVTLTRVVYKIIIYLVLHSIYYKYGPESLHSMWVTYEQRGINQDLRDSHQLYTGTPFARTEQVKRLPYFSMHRIWNNLPDCELPSNPTTFKIAQKWHLHNLVQTSAQ